MLLMACNQRHVSILQKLHKTEMFFDEAQEDSAKESNSDKMSIVWRNYQINQMAKAFN